MNFKKYHVSKNLFSASITQGVWAGNTGTSPYVSPSTRRICTSNIINLDSAKTYTIAPRQPDMYVVVKTLDSNGNITSDSGWKSSVTFNNVYAIVATFRFVDESEISPQDFIGAMLNEGSTPLPYEPYSSEVWHDTTHYIHNSSTDTITTLPFDIYADGNTATVGLKGNTVQSGTPTPDNPVDVNGVGERTGNLFDLSTATNEFINSNGAITPSSARDPYYLSDYISADNVTISVQYKETAATEIFTVGIYDSSKNFIRRDVISNNSVSYENVAYIRINYRDKNCQNVMLNLGSTPLPYEPYGYKIPISSASTTTPVYLGEVQTTRKIKKLVLTGGDDENWNITNNSKVLYLAVSDFLKEQGTICYCTHYETVNNVSSADDVNDGDCTFNDHLNWLYIKDSNYTNAQGFKKYLAAQYAAGTPVCVWYVLANETTGIVNEPLMRIGNYADEVSGITAPTITGKDTFDVDTTLKPSEVSLSYTGWHDAEVKEKSRNLFDYSTVAFGKYINAVGEEVSSSGTGEQALNHSDFITITAETVYTFKCEKSTIESAESNAFCWFDSSKQLINRYLFSIDAVSPYILGTATAPTNAAYLIMNYRGLHGDTAMLNTGSTALPYEPYWT